MVKLNWCALCLSVTAGAAELCGERARAGVPGGVGAGGEGGDSHQADGHGRGELLQTAQSLQIYRPQAKMNKF